MPDQDVLNALYSKEIKKLDEVKYNYDTRYYLYYKIQNNGKVNMDYIMQNTVILHFAGKINLGIPIITAILNPFISIMKY